MNLMNEDPIRYRIIGTTGETDEHPPITFHTQMYFAWDPGVLDVVKEDAEKLRAFFGLKDYEVHIESTTDQWKKVDL